MRGDHVGTPSILRYRCSAARVDSNSRQFRREDTEVRCRCHEGAKDNDSVHDPSAHELWVAFADVAAGFSARELVWLESDAGEVLVS